MMRTTYIPGPEAVMVDEFVLHRATAWDPIMRRSKAGIGFVEEVMRYEGNLQSITGER
jgi:hypothetical protein